MTPTALVELLNKVFSYFDLLVEKYGLEKIKTIGDCYMVASGVPRPRDDHAQVLIAMALEMRDYVSEHQFSGRQLTFRIGVNSGPVVAGVIGRKKFIYDLWGDAVNTASRMESHGQGGFIQITRATYELVKDDFVCESHGIMNVKGKGEGNVMNRKIMYAGKFWLRVWVGCFMLLLPLAQAQAQSPKTYGKSDAPVAAEARGVQIRTSNPDEMAYVIKQILLQHYVEEQDLQATDKEIAQLLERKQEVMEKDRKAMDARRSEIEKALASKTPAGEERKQLEQELEALNAMHQAMTAADSRAGTPESAAAEARVAGAFVEQWKVNQALYRKYGGRVIYQQSGAEPLDAHYAFLKAAQKSGELTIVNKDFETVLWSYYTTDSMHQFIPESGNKKEQAINTPWWMMEENTGQ